MFETFFSILAGAMALASGFLWLRAARVEIPSVMSEPWEGRGPFSEALAEQAELNKYAAYAM